MFNLDINTNSYCDSTEKIKYSKNYGVSYIGGIAVSQTEDNKCSFEKASEISKALLENNVELANKLITELEKKVGVN
jgi:hypothetical protein